MKRKAFLIGSPLIQGNSGYLQGVTPDIINMRQHLKSLKGGAWEDNEIIVFENPKDYDLTLSFLANQELDYAIIQYSGHGFEYKHDGTQFKINNNQNYSMNLVQSLLKPKRAFYFIDCCRGIEHMEHKAEFSEAVAMDSLSSNIDIRTIYKNKFNNLVSECELGLTAIYSVSLNESADEDPNGLGGIFSKSYFASINARKDNLNWDIKELFNFAISKMQSTYGLVAQNPQISSQRRLKYFPIIVNL